MAQKRSPQWEIKAEDGRIFLVDRWAGKDDPVAFAGEIRVEPPGRLIIPFEPAARSAVIPFSKITLEGKWKVSENHDLIFEILRSSSPMFGHTLLFRGEFLDVTGHKLVFSSGARRTAKGVVRNVFEFEGEWRAANNQRLLFAINKSRSKEESILAFKNTWKIGAHHELVYTYKKEEGRSKAKITKNIIFYGRWDLKRNALVYSLDGEPGRPLVFAVTFSRKIIEASRGRIEIRLKGESPSKGIIVFYGTWKVLDNLKLAFEIELSKGERRRWEFKADWKVTDKNRMTAALFDAGKKPLGMSILFTRRVGADKDVWLKLERRGHEDLIWAGMSMPF